MSALWPKLKESDITKWIAALESGDHRQGRGFLRIIIDGQQHHCCLGLLMKIVDEGLYHHEINSDNSVSYCGKRALLHIDTDEELKRLIGIDGGALARLNDTSATFFDIALVIRSSIRAMGAGVPIGLVPSDLIWSGKLLEMSSEEIVASIRKLEPMERGPFRRYGDALPFGKNAAPSELLKGFALTHYQEAT